MLERKFYAGSAVDQIQGGKESYTVTAASRYGGLGVLFISKLSFQFCAQFVFSIFLFNFISNAYFLIFLFNSLREQDTAIVVESERKKVIDLRRVLFLPTNM